MRRGRQLHVTIVQKFGISAERHRTSGVEPRRRDRSFPAGPISARPKRREQQSSKRSRPVASEVGQDGLSLNLALRLRSSISRSVAADRLRRRSFLAQGFFDNETSLAGGNEPLEIILDGVIERHVHLPHDGLPVRFIAYLSLRSARPVKVPQLDSLKL